jgi:hypothetical protein
MAKQKFIDAVRGKRTETAPWVPYAGVHCAFVINEPADKYLPEVLSRRQKNTRQTGYRWSLIFPLKHIL